MKESPMKHLPILLTIAALAGAASTDSLAVRRFQEASARANLLWARGDSLHVQAQGYQQAAWDRLQQDTARPANGK
jgi:hypothetical protein